METQPQSPIWSVKEWHRFRRRLGDICEDLSRLSLEMHQGDWTIT